MTLPPTPEGLPPLPKGLRGALALQHTQSDWREQEKVHALKQAIQKDLVENNNQEDPEKQKSMQGSLTQLRKDMVSLRQLDLSLLCQLLRLYENIQDWKQMLSDNSSQSDFYDYGTFATVDRQTFSGIKEEYQTNTMRDGLRTPEKTTEEPIYENTPASRPSFWHTRRKSRTSNRDLSRSNSRSPARSPALDNPDFEESMLGPTSTPRRLSKHHNVNSAAIPRYISRTHTGSHGLGASETLAWLASGSPSKSQRPVSNGSVSIGSVSNGSVSNGSASHGSVSSIHTSSSVSLDRSSMVGHNGICTPCVPLGMSKSYHQEVPLNHTSTPVTPLFNESNSWSPFKRPGSVSTESDESLYLEPLPCQHTEHHSERHHRGVWKQSPSPTYENCSNFSGYERQLSANSSYLYESTL